MHPVGKIVDENGRRAFRLVEGAAVTGDRWSYKVVGTRGQGGFAKTYVVRRVGDNLLAVLKMSSDAKKNTPGAERIRREAFVMRKCGRDNPCFVPQILDEGVVDGRPFLVVENLCRLEWSSSETGLPDTEEKRKAFFMLLIDCVKAIHEAGFVHCDIKPGNIMQRPGDHRPLLIDFGSAHIIDKETGRPASLPPEWKDVTRKVGSAWTPGYDDGGDQFTAQKDIFAIGQVIRDSFGKDVDLAWTEIINSCISRRRDFRYESLDDLRKDIECVNKRRREIYWQLRKERIAEQREIERSLAEAPRKTVELHEVLRRDDSLPDGEMLLFHVRFPPKRRLHYVLEEPIELKGNTILLISGKGILEAQISGPSSSVVVLRDYATFHNMSAKLPPENDLTYVVVGPGSYLNFPNVKSEDYQRFFPGRRRILRDIDATTSFRFNGPKTFSGVEDETLRAIEESRMPERYKTILSGFFKGEEFSVMPS